MEFKYNPGFSSDADLIESFVVRKPYLDLILENLRENTGSANQHVLVVGARGTGKTMLVRRVAAEVRTDPQLNVQWYPLVFAEESYQITSVGEFWLEALFHVADQTQDANWQAVYEELRTEVDEKRLRQRALAQLMDFADAQGKRILLVVENLNMLFAEQLGKHDDWELRHTLQNEPRLMLLGTATQRFEQIEAIQKAWFEFFTIYQLEALSLEDCRVLWTGISGKPVHDNRLKPIQILTGGNPRLLRILIDFAVDLSLKDLMGNLSQLIDEHTDYFKSHLDNLAAAERKVFIALLDLWDPKGARDIATIARMNVSQVSSLLNRLVSRGAVMVVQAKGRKKLYQATERLYNIYYLMRRRSHPSSRVQAAVTFMVSFYQGSELVDVTAKLANEACLLNPTERADYFYAYQGIWDATKHSKLREKLLKATPQSFLSASDAPDSLRHLIKLSTLEQKQKGYQEISKDNDLLKLGSHEEVISDYDKALELQPNNYDIWFNRGVLLGLYDKYKEAIFSFNKVLKYKENDLNSLFLRGIAHSQLNQTDKALLDLEKALEIRPDDYSIWSYHGMTLEQAGRYQDAIRSLDKAISLNKNDFKSWGIRGVSLAKLNRYEEALNSFDRSLELNPDNFEDWYIRGVTLKILGRYEEAILSFEKTLKIDPNYYFAWNEKGRILFLLSSYEDAEFCIRKALEYEPNNYIFLFDLGLVLISQAKWSDFLVLIDLLLSAINVDIKAIQILTNFSITAASVGYAKEVLQKINNSNASHYLEPLVVGLRIFLGDQTLVAKEILEVAQDVAQCIREKQQALQDVEIVELTPHST
jgi:tetratricopeptide (TPR) repeat protein